MLTSDEQERLIDAVIKRIEPIFMSKAECEIKNEKIQADISKMSTDIAIMRTLQDKSNKTQNVIASAVITGVVGLIVAVIVWAVKQGAV